MRYVSIAAAQRKFVRADNPAGFWDGLDKPGLLDRLCDLCGRGITPGARYGGVAVIAAYGKLQTGRVIGTRTDGSLIETYWAGPSEGPIHPIVARLAERVPNVLATVGMPINYDGFRQLADDRAALPANVRLAFDACGQNTAFLPVLSAVKYAGPGAMLEPAPLPALRVPKLDAVPKLSMAHRARKLAGLGLPFGEFVIYNAGDDANAWDEREASEFERMGAVVVQPLETVET